MELKELILETCKAHADTARAAYKSRDREIAILKGQISVLEQTLAALRSENIVLRAKVHQMGGETLTDGLVVR